MSWICLKGHVKTKEYIDIASTPVSNNIIIPSELFTEVLRIFSLFKSFQLFCVAVLFWEQHQHHEKDMNAHGICFDFNTGPSRAKLGRTARQQQLLTLTLLIWTQKSLISWHLRRCMENIVNWGKIKEESQNNFIYCIVFCGMMTKLGYKCSSKLHVWMHS